MASSRVKRRLHNEAMEFIVGCFGGLGFLSAMLPKVASGLIGMMLLFGGSLIALLYIIAQVRGGRSLGRSFILAILPAVISFCLLYGCTWYFTSYLASQPNLFKF